MKVEVDGIVYETQYFPFFRMEQRKGYTKFGLKYPSGFIEEFIVFDEGNYLEELRKHLTFLVREYMLEDDEMLTPFAQRLKDDVHELFHGEKRRNVERNDRILRG